MSLRFTIWTLTAALTACAGAGVVEDAQALNGRAGAQSASGDWQAALASLDRACALLPGNATLAANRDRAAINVAIGMAEAGRDFREALDFVESTGASGEFAERRSQAGGLVEQLWARACEASGEDEQQRVHLERSLEWQPAHVEVLMDLAEWHQARAESEVALPLFTRAAQLEPSLDRARWMMELIERDRRATAEHEEASSEHFAIRFPRGKRDYAETVLGILERERARIGGALHRAPSRCIPAVIYTPEQFQEVTQAPHWALASYDGLIRVAVRATETSEERAGLEDTLSHELTHAFIFDLAHDKAPPWLGEGLAQNMEAHFHVTARAMADLRGCVRTGELTPIPRLPLDFAEIPSTRQAQIAYLSSACFVQLLLERFGGAALCGVLMDLRGGESIEDAIQRNLHQSLDDLDREWREGL